MNLISVEERVINLQKHCHGQSSRKGRLSPRTDLLSRFGISLGSIPFWTCIAPKCGSTSLSASLLLLTGFIDAKMKNNVTWEMWNLGRNHCDRIVPKSNKCLQKYKEMVARESAKSTVEPWLTIAKRTCRWSSRSSVSIWRTILYLFYLFANQWIV